MADEPSTEKKEAMIALVRWVRMMIPDLPESASPQEYYDRMTGTQRRRVQWRLAEISLME